MADVLPLVVDGLAGLQEDLELLKAIQELAEKWTSLAAQVGSLETLESFLGTFGADVDSETIKAAFHAAGQDDLHGRLARLLAKVNGALGSLPPQYKLLLKPLSDFEGKDDNFGTVGWTLLDKGAATPDGRAYALSLKGKAAVSFEAGEVWPFPDDAVSERLLRIGADGQVGATASAGAPYAYGKLSAEAAASTGLTLDYYFGVRDPHALYAMAVAERLAALPNAFDFDSLWQAIAQSDAAGLRAVTYAFKGSSALSVSVSFADTGVILKEVGADLGITVSAGFSRKGDVTLSLRKDPGRPGAILATLSKLQETGLTFGEAVTLTLDLSQLGARLHQVLEKTVAHWDDLLEKIKPYLKPGTLIREKAKTELDAAAGRLITDEALRAAVVRDLHALIGSEAEDTSKLTEWLKSQISDALDRGGKALTDAADQAATRAVAALGEGVPALSQQSVKDRLLPELQTLIDAGKKVVSDEVAALFAEKGDALLDALNRAGAKASNAVDKADEALKKVRDLIDKYDAVFHEVLAASEKAAKTKLTAQLALEEKIAKGFDFQLRGSLTAPTEEARRLFGALVKGSLAELTPLLDAASTPGFELDRAASSLTRYSRRQQTASFSLVLLGFGGLKITDVLITGAKAMVDGENKVRIDSSASLTRDFVGANGARSISFVDTYALRVARATSAPGAGDRLMEVSLGLVTQDKTLTAAELGRLIDSFIRVRLLSEDAKTKATQQLNRWGLGADRPLPADTAVKLWLEGGAIERMLMLGDRDPNTGKLTAAAQETLINVAGRALSDADPGPHPTWLEEARAYAQNWFWPDARGTAPFSMGRTVLAYKHDFHNVPPLGSDHRANAHYRMALEFSREVERFMSLVTVFDAMGETYLATPRGAGPDDGRSWTEENYRAAQDRIGGNVRPWFGVGTKWFAWIQAEAHPRTVALFRTLATLSGYGDASPAAGDARASPPITLTLTRKDGPADTVVVV